MTDETLENEQNNYHILLRTRAVSVFIRLLFIVRSVWRTGLIIVISRCLCLRAQRASKKRSRKQKKKKLNIYKETLCNDDFIRRTLLFLFALSHLSVVLSTFEQYRLVFNLSKRFAFAMDHVEVAHGILFASLLPTRWITSSSETK